ncbi:hypothetical protein AGMMS49928_17380 [Spirochaetia bacterium]|nr:hypothetical protein AGMMS49928_17380 [Spirochaetia bacterium]
MANKPEEFPLFTKLDNSAITGLLGKFNQYLAGFSSSTGIAGIATFENTLLEIFERIEKRRVYFHIFYDGCKMGELNEGALMCFWIVKLCPFVCSGIPSDVLNAKIALFLFNSVLSFIAKKSNKKVLITSQIIKDLYYSFRFRDISKESIMLLAESLVQ